MARFKYNGEKPREGLVVSYGPCTVIRLRCTPTTDPAGRVALTPIPPATEFIPGEDIGYAVTDDVMLRQLRATDEPRFTEIV